MKKAPSILLDSRKFIYGDITYQKSIFERTETGETNEQIYRLAPYDETDYHRATRNFPGSIGNPWRVFLAAEYVQDLDCQATYDEVIAALMQLDAAKGLKRRGGIH